MPRRLQPNRGGALLPLTGGALLAALVSGCGSQSPLDPKSGPARDIATLWWWMLAIAGVVFLGAVALLALAWISRGQEGIPLLGSSARLTTWLVVAFGILIPIPILVGVFVVANFVVMPSTDAPAASSTAMTIRVIGHQWFWEVRYRGGSVVTANEIHIPVRTRVNVVATSADVIHSFWVPQLNRKIDTLPGHPNRLLLFADKPGRYRGQCAEYCGLQHAHMGTYVIAEPQDEFRAWLADMERPARRPSTGRERIGKQVFLDNACASCHTIAGTGARGRVGPDLTHLATRSTIGALTIPNTPRDLRAWIADPQHFKPGNKRPALGLSKSDLRDLTAYLESLR
jgi:cytochrome c oxidase subunit 2